MDGGVVLLVSSPAEDSESDSDSETVTHFVCLFVCLFTYKLQFFLDSSLIITSTIKLICIWYDGIGLFLRQSSLSSRRVNQSLTLFYLTDSGYHYWFFPSSSISSPFLSSFILFVSQYLNSPHLYWYDEAKFPCLYSIRRNQVSNHHHPLRKLLPWSGQSLVLSASPLPHGMFSPLLSIRLVLNRIH